MVVTTEARVARQTPRLAFLASPLLPWNRKDSKKGQEKVPPKNKYESTPVDPG